MGGGGVLPEYEHLIIDEAHNLEDEATDALGFTVDRPLVMKLLGELSASANSLGVSDDFLSKPLGAAARCRRRRARRAARARPRPRATCSCR